MIRVIIESECYIWLRKKVFRSADDMPSSKFCTNPVAKNFVDFSFQKKFSVEDKIFK